MMFDADEDDDRPTSVTLRAFDSARARVLDSAEEFASIAPPGKEGQSDG